MHSETQELAKMLAHPLGYAFVQETLEIETGKLSRHTSNAAGFKGDGALDRETVLAIS